MPNTQQFQSVFPQRKIIIIWPHICDDMKCIPYSYSLSLSVSFLNRGMHIGVVWIRNFCVHRWGISFVNLGRWRQRRRQQRKTTVANWLEANWYHSISMHHYLLVLALLAAYLTLSQMYCKNRSYNNSTIESMWTDANSLLGVE